MSERERLRRPERELGERPATETKRSAGSDGRATDHASREAQLWRDLGAARAPNDLEDAATLALEKRGAGQLVPAEVAALVRADTGVDVSSARFHNDPLSQKVVRAMGARAFAYGNDIFLGPGESEHDQALMAHELTHVVQQRGSAPTPQRKVAVGAESSPAEQHADQVAANVTAGTAAAQQLLVDGGTLGPGQMLKSSFLERLKPFVTAAADTELGMIGSAVACPYIAQYFAKYAALPAKSSTTLIQRWVPEARTVTSAEALIPLLVARVRAGVQYWKQTHKLPPDLAAADPAAAQAAETNQAPRSTSDAQPIVNRKSLDGMEAELGAGRSLDHATGQRMSAVVGADVSGAKIHTGPTANAMASEHGAAAFAVGNNVVMGSSAPTTGVAGDALLAHELAHTAQQADAHKDPVARRQPIGAEDQGAERDAGLARLGNFAGAVGDVMRTGLQLQRCQAGEVDPGPTTQAYYEQYLVQIAAGAADQLRALPFATYDDTVTWTAAGVTQFAGAMADQITAKTDLDSLVRPELIGKLVAESRVVTKVEPAGVDGGAPVSKGPDSYFPSVGTEVGNALARRTAESLQREIPRYAQAKIANGKEPGPDDVVMSHPIDPLVIAALAKGNMVAIDQVKFKQRHPELAGPPKLVLASQNIQLEDVKGLPGWHRLISPATATPEEIVVALGLPATESFRLQVAHPLYGLEDDTRGKFAEVENPIGRAAQLARSNGPEAAEAALSQAGPVDPKDARPRERILEEMRVNANVLRTSVAPIAEQFQLEEKVITAATMIEHRVAQLETQDDGDVAKWDAHSKKQSDIISRAGAGLAGDGARLDAYKAANKDSAAAKGTIDGLPPDHPLRQDAELWANALLACDLVDSAAQMIAAASRHTLTLEIEILERGLSTPQSASFQASDTTEAKQDFDTEGMGKREIEERKQLGQLRAQMMSQMLGDPSKVDPKAAGTTQDARNLIFESQVAAQAAQLEHEWASLDQAVDSWTTLGGDRRDAAALKVRAKDYYGRWKAIYALIKKGEAGDKVSMDKARTDFETLAADKKFQGFLKEVQDELKVIHEDQMIVMIIAMVAITLVSMGAGSALSATLGGTALVVDGTEIVVGGMGVARNTAAVAGFLAETATFTVLSNVAFSKDHSVGAFLSDFAKNLVMFGAMRGVGMGVKAMGLSRMFKAGEEASKLAKFAAAAGDAVGQSMINGGIGVTTMWVEQKVKEMFGGKPMTAQEQNDAIIMAVSQAVIFSIGGRLMESPIKKLEVSAALAGKEWQLALDGWATERKANLVMQDKVTKGGKVSAADVIEAAHRDQAQIDKEMDALEALKKAANRDQKGAAKQGINDDVLDQKMKTLNDLRANSLGVEMAMTMKPRGPNFFEAGAAEVARMRALETAEGATVVPEGPRDPGTGAQTWRITPKGDNATPILVAESVPDWAITPSGKQIVEVARRAKLDDAQIYSLTEQQRTALLALKNAVEQGGQKEIDHTSAQLKDFSPEQQKALADAFHLDLGEQNAAKQAALDPAVAKEQAELQRIRTGQPGKLRPASELSDADVAHSMNAQLENVKPGQVDTMVDSFSPDQQEKARIVLARSSGFGQMEGLNSLRKAMEPFLKKAGGKVYTPGKGSLGDNMVYLDAEKHSFDKPMANEPTSGVTPVRSNAITQDCIVILDDVVLAKLKDPVTGPGFAAELKAKSAVLLNPRGFTSGNTMYSARSPEAIARQTHALLDSANAIQAAEPGLPFDDAVTRALDLQVSQAIEASGVKDLQGQLVEVDPTGIAPGGSLDTSSDAIAGQLNSAAGITEAQVATILSQVPESDRPYLRELLAQQAEVYSPRRQSNALAEQAEKIAGLADQQGIPQSNVYYFIPKPDKSYGMVAMAHRQATGTPIGRYIEGPAELAARVQSGELGPQSMVVIFDDVAGSGDSLVTATNMTKGSGYQGKIAVSPIVSTGVAQRVFDGVQQGNPNVSYVPGELAHALRETPLFQGLNPAQQQHLLDLIGHSPNSNALGYDENGLSMAFPYMAPDNNNYFFGEQFAEEYVMNKNDHPDAVKTYGPWKPKQGPTTP